MVRVWKSVMGQNYSAEGIVTAVQKGWHGELLIFVDGDWYEADNDLENRCTVLKRAPERG